MRSSRRNLGLQPEVTPEDSESGSDTRPDPESDLGDEDMDRSVNVNETVSRRDDEQSKILSDVNVEDSSQSEISEYSEIQTVPAKS